MALSAALRKHGGLWFDWSGRAYDDPAAEATVHHFGGIDIATLDLGLQDVADYYDRFANRTLLPLCHYRTHLIMHERSFKAAYRRVNERFAAALMPLLREDDVLWVHDYYLIFSARLCLASPRRPKPHRLLSPHRGRRGRCSPCAAHPTCTSSYSKREANVLLRAIA